MELPVTRKLGTKGRLVLPPLAIKKLGAKPGDEIKFDVAEGKVTVRKK